MRAQEKSRAPDKRTTFSTTNLHKQNSTAVKLRSIGTSQNSVTDAISDQTTVCLSHVRRNQLSLHSRVFPGNGSVVDRDAWRVCVPRIDPYVLVLTASVKKLSY